jgi:hypothetical protein
MNYRIFGAVCSGASIALMVFAGITDPGALRDIAAPGGVAAGLGIVLVWVG